MRKRLKRLLRLRNSTGFTLAEVVIACALLGILILGIMGFVTPILSSVREKQKNARAYMLSEAVDTYIEQTIQYAYFVATFSGVAYSDTTGASPRIVSAKYEKSSPGAALEFPKREGKSLESLKACFSKMEADTFEVRCIGVRWHRYGNEGGWKLMLTNEQVDQTTLALDPNKSKLVFEECFYDDLFPIIKFENYNNQYSKKISGVATEQVKPEDLDVAPGLRIVTDVYTNPECYSTSAGTRENALFTMNGESYVGLNNIKSNLKNKGDYEIVPNIEVNTYAAALAADSSRKCSIDGAECYYPESFIYYIVRKTKTTAPTP